MRLQFELSSRVHLHVLQMLNQQKRHGGRDGRVSESGRTSQPQATSYGCSKKSLGTRSVGRLIILSITILVKLSPLCVIHFVCRRAPGNRFVPPVRREEGEGGGRDGGVDAVRSRVQYGGPNREGGGGCVPPELAGDERLKNVEPRMVELIMNEVGALC